MLNILLFLYDLIDQHIIWLYLACFAMILYYVRAYALAHRDRSNTIFTIEREVAAHREGRAMSSIGTVLAFVVVLTAIKFYLLPTIDLTELAEPTPTLIIPIPTRETPTPTPLPSTPTLTPRPRPTHRPIMTVVPPTLTPVPAASCADPNICISSPGLDQVVAGRISIRGTADHAQFQFFKVEFGQGAEPSVWHVINDVRRVPVVGGELESFDTTVIPNGVYSLQLTVVDVTGNYPPPHRVRITVQN